MMRQVFTQSEKANHYICPDAQRGCVYQTRSRILPSLPHVLRADTSLSSFGLSLRNTILIRAISQPRGKALGLTQEQVRYWQPLHISRILGRGTGS